MRIIARQMAQHMKHIFRIGIDRVGNLFCGFPGVSREFCTVFEVATICRRFFPASTPG
jgi:hypothetical protein